jgi:hypothetical protein
LIGFLADTKIHRKWICVVLMKRSFFAFFCIVLFAAAVSARSQVVPAATGRTFSLNVGGMGSVFQPDYAGNLIAQASPNRLYGAGAYVDAHFSRWLQIEAEGRWMRFNQYYWGDPPTGNGEDTYLIGPRIAPYTFRKFTPYGKALVGFGNGNFLTGRCLAVAYGGGVDYRLTRRFTLRAFDFEYQQWRVTPTLYPYGGSVGLSYKIF